MVITVELKPQDAHEIWWLLLAQAGRSGEAQKDYWNGLAQHIRQSIEDDVCTPTKEDRHGRS